MVHFHDKNTQLGMEENFPNLIKSIYEKLITNIIFSDKKTEDQDVRSCHLRVRVRARVRVWVYIYI